MKKVVYSCLFSDGKRKIDEPYIKEEDKLVGWDYIMFTNIPDKIINTGWTPISKPIVHNSAVYSAKCYKWLAHQHIVNYDIAIYVDAYLSPKKDINWQDYIDKLNSNVANNGIILLKHPVRNCIYKECEIIYKYRKDKIENMQKVINFLKNEGMPEAYGLYECGLFIRHLKNKDFNRLCEELFVLMLRYTYRDQALLSYVFWKNQVKINAEFTRDFYFVSGKMGDHNYT
ncbi:hypothetical protein Klosneuvirus_1_318 [Klosneuvirus KNV1]|mgnify:CR=1 FL=1|uniref:Glycosyltransferase n=1 Tax=Klosneuvirus KNV1 TaxID=1977640 RepID=A0A1V0SIH1_9VIRU|nr:hypothetical protein Klosneuvirus_1_318 [Klosneuvirus KNV1]